MFKTLPPLNTLVAFEAAARLNSFTDAANELYLTPGAVAYQIKKLESLIELELFTRLHQGVALNAAGDEYLSVVKNLLHNLNTQTNRLKEKYGVGSIRVLTLHAIAEKWLMPRLPGLRKNYEHIKIDIHATDNLNDEIDSDIVFGYARKLPRIENCIPLMEEEVFPVCSVDFLDKNPQLKTSEGVNCCNILSDIQWHGDWDAWLEINGLTNQIKERNSLNFNLYSMVIDAAVKGLGLAMGHYQLIQSELQQGLLIRPLQSAESSKGIYYLINSNGDSGNTLTQYFIQWLKTRSESNS